MAMSQPLSVSIALLIELAGCAAHVSSLTALMCRIVTYAAPAGVTIMDAHRFAEGWTASESPSRLASCVREDYSLASDCGISSSA